MFFSDLFLHQSLDLYWMHNVMQGLFQNISCLLQSIEMKNKIDC